ncbi:MAG: hypothetical protein O8C63_03805 [Candidatus Methanoperedens sp.]|nr:hypothetical protein [Candidatus Methanoperedens sp.]
MKQEKSYDLEWSETRFSACLIGYMRQIKQQRGIELRIEPESYLYQEKILKGCEDPATAPRIDIKISGSWVHEDIYYGLEAKILVETDWKKRSASYLLNRYIKTGIGNFVNGRYSHEMSRGCITGYVLQGSTPEIVLKINNILLQDGRSKEVIEKSESINGCPHYYQSRHIRNTDKKKIELQHVFLTFV